MIFFVCQLNQWFLTFLKETPPWAIDEVIIAPLPTAIFIYLFIQERHLNPMTPENKIQQPASHNRTTRKAGKAAEFPPRMDLSQPCP